MPESKLPTAFYQQFDADLSIEVPAQAYGGWQKTDLPLDLDHTALVVMHAWDVGTPAQKPGWFRAVEYLPRSYAIAENVFPPLLEAARRAKLTVLHVVGGSDYYSRLPGYSAHSADPPEDRDPRATPDRTYDELVRFRGERVFPGASNQPDIDTGQDFHPSAQPQDDERIAADSAELAALCAAAGINHLVYVGFALNVCLLSSAGGMVDMTRLGYICSTVRGATTAVENKETARDQLNLASAYWRVAVLHGFVYELDDFVAFLESNVR
ncbi:hypothetical protein [Streptomyces sp. NPDC001508]|uniref:hypothetical protein n=1 Tax=Streptomyces sp. NPDC001508 TaxID=3154656 RepID=UPI003332A357